MDSLNKMIAENMKQTDTKLGIELIALFVEAYIKSDRSDEHKRIFLESKITEIIKSMATPIFSIDK